MQIAKHASDKLLSMAVEHTEHTYSNVNSESDGVKLFDKLMAPCGEGCVGSTVPSVLTEVNKRPPKNWALVTKCALTWFRSWSIQNDGGKKKETYDRNKNLHDSRIPTSPLYTNTFSLVGLLGGWLGGWMGGWLGGWLVGWVVGWLVGWLCGA